MKIRHSDNRGKMQSNLRGFEEFYRLHYVAVSRFVARRVPPDSHDDVVASTFVVAWRKFDHITEPALPWLYRTAGFEVAHEHRRLAKDLVLADLDDPPFTDVFSLENTFDLSLALDEISNADAELLRLIHWEELSREDVARTLSCSVNAVNVRYHRAIERVSGALNRLSITSEYRLIKHELPKED
jgi:RNA polymerase sigma factor (sigma-70 family)